MKIELVARGVRIKPPTFSKNAKKYNEPFLYCEEPTVKQIEALCQSAGMTRIKHSIDIWLHIKSGAGPHSDNYGMCLVYLAKGSGTLYVLYRGKIEERHAEPGDVLLFNDKLTHWWMSDTPCTLMAINVKKERDL